jgi:hypothetical protein
MLQLPRLFSAIDEHYVGICERLAYSVRLQGTKKSQSANTKGMPVNVTHQLVLQRLGL